MPEPNPNLAELLTGLTLYRQKREDGGVRTGITLGPEEIFERFTIKGEEFNPYLLWSIDVRCKGPSLPDSSEEARDWLLSNDAMIRQGLESFAIHLNSWGGPLGEDPFVWDDFPSRPSVTSIEVFCFARRRVTSAYLSRRVKYLAESWSSLIRALKPSFHEAR